MSRSRIIVVGSSNTDMVIRTDRFPKPGETILGKEFFMNQGGKGANQAVAAARLGGKVVLVASVGDDVFGKAALQSLWDEGIDVSYVLMNKDKPSGVALITVDKQGENNIVVASGANNDLLTERISGLDVLLKEASFVLMQLEIPIETVEEITSQANNGKIKVILNPAPARELSSSILRNLYLITPNEEEASLLTGIEVVDVQSAKEAAQVLVNKGVKNVVITMGAKGAVALFDGECFDVNAHSVRALDTTAAGDVFNGALVVALNEDKPIREALEFAALAAGIAVTRLGAQSSSPYREELNAYYQTTQNQI